MQVSGSSVDIIPLFRHSALVHFDVMRCAGTCGQSFVAKGARERNGKSNFKLGTTFKVQKGFDGIRFRDICEYNFRK